MNTPTRATMQEVRRLLAVRRYRLGRKAEFLLRDVRGVAVNVITSGLVEVETTGPLVKNGRNDDR